MSGPVIVNPELLKKVADELGLAAAVVARTVYRSLNSVAGKNTTRSRREVVSRVNLKDKYVRDRMDLQKASPKRATAVIAARRRSTTLATYGALQKVKAAPEPKNGKRRHPLRGDPLRGIPAGKIQAGISVSVKRGSGRKIVEGGKSFFVPLQAGSRGGAANGFGVFIRTGSGRRAIRHQYGPSVNDVLRQVFPDIQPDVQAELEAALLRQARYEFGKALGK